MFPEKETLLPVLQFVAVPSCPIATLLKRVQPDPFAFRTLDTYRH